MGLMSVRNRPICFTIHAPLICMNIEVARINHEANWTIGMPCFLLSYTCLAQANSLNFFFSCFCFQRLKRASKEEPSRAEIFIMTHTRKDGTPIDEEAAIVIVCFLKIYHHFFVLVINIVASFRLIFSNRRTELVSGSRHFLRFILESTTS